MYLNRRVRKELLLSLLLVGCFSFFGYLCLGSGGIVELIEYRGELNRLKVANARLLQEKQSLQVDIDKLKNDSYAMERLAREQLNYARQGEIIIQDRSRPADRTESD